MQATTPTSGRETTQRLPIHDLFPCEPYATNIVEATTQTEQPRTWRNLSPAEAQARIAALRIAPTIHNIYLNHHPVVIRWYSDTEPHAPACTTPPDHPTDLIQTAIDAMAHQNRCDDKGAMYAIAQYLADKTGRAYSLGDIYAWKHRHETPQIHAAYHLMVFALPYALQMAMTRSPDRLDQLRIAQEMITITPAPKPC